MSSLFRTSRTLNLMEDLYGDEHENGDCSRLDAWLTDLPIESMDNSSHLHTFPFACTPNDKGTKPHQGADTEDEFERGAESEPSLNTRNSRSFDKSTEQSSHILFPLAPERFELTDEIEGALPSFPFMDCPGLLPLKIHHRVPSLPLDWEVSPRLPSLPLDSEASQRIFETSREADDALDRQEAIAPFWSREEPRSACQTQHGEENVLHSSATSVEQFKITSGEVFSDGLGSSLAHPCQDSESFSGSGSTNFRSRRVPGKSRDRWLDEDCASVLDIDALQKEGLWWGPVSPKNEHGAQLQHMDWGGKSGGQQLWLGDENSKPIPIMEEGQSTDEKLKSFHNVEPPGRTENICKGCMLGKKLCTMMSSLKGALSKKQQK